MSDEIADLRPARLHVDCTAGLPLTIALVYKQTNLTGYACAVKVKAGTTDILTASVGSGVTIAYNSPVTGDSTVTIVWTETTMDAVMAGDYVWEVLPATGGIVQTALSFKGRFSIESEFAL